jgi:hypothetical protein
MAEILSQVVPDPLTEDLDILIQGNTSFGVKTDAISFDAVNLNGKTITFRTEPGDNPATLFGMPVSDGAVSSGTVKFLNLISAAGDASGLDNVANVTNTAYDFHFVFENNLIYRRLTAATARLFYFGSADDGSVSNLINNCQLFFTSTLHDNNHGVIQDGLRAIKETIYTTSSRGTIKNSTIGVFINILGTPGGSAGTQPLQLYFSSPLTVNNNVSIYDYNAGNPIDVFYENGATAPDLIKDINFNLTDQVIQAFDDTLEAMLARNAKLTNTSACMLGNADPATATAFDILDHSRS